MDTVSVLIPVKDEQETIQALASQIAEVFKDELAGTASLNEIIFIDDGSMDDSWSSILSAMESDPVVRGIRFRRNFGKAAALQEGIANSTGSIIVTMDGDLQDLPREIPRFIAAIESGYDVVSGWKQTRNDPLGKTIPSRLFNWVTSKVSKVPIHDFNCGFKAYRREVFTHLSLYGELHRFIPALAYAMGFKVTEIVVEHHPRRFGRSKYGLARLLKGFLDLLAVVTITRFNSRPGHLFGGLGVVVGGLGGFIILYLTAEWFAGYPIGGRPLLVIGSLLTIVGVQFVLFGMVAELIVNLRVRNTVSGYVAEIAMKERAAKAPRSSKTK